jgi:hypothetical protein
MGRLRSQPATRSKWKVGAGALQLEEPGFSRGIGDGPLFDLDARLRLGYGKQSQNLSQFLAHFVQPRFRPLHCLLLLRQREFRLTSASFAARLCLNRLTGAGDSVTLVIQQPLHPQCHLYIAPAIQPLPGAAFVWLELGKLTLPKAQNIRRNRAQARHLADAKVKLIGDLRFLRCAVLRKVSCHTRYQVKTLCESTYAAQKYRPAGLAVVGFLKPSCGFFTATYQL